MELDNPAWWSLQGAQRSLGVVTERAARFAEAVSPFGAFGSEPTEADWAEMATLTGPGGSVALISADRGQPEPLNGWTVSWTSPGVQMVAASGVVGRPGLTPGVGPTDTVVLLGKDDVPDMLDLVAAARPGPFSSRTIEFGGYLGVRRNGRLVAMAGERLRPPGHAEVSAVATDPDHRRQGLAGLLIAAVARGIEARGEIPFLHAATGNTTAIRLYEALGFSVRRTVQFSVVEAPSLGSPRLATGSTA